MYTYDEKLLFQSVSRHEVIITPLTFEHDSSYSIPIDPTAISFSIMKFSFIALSIRIDHDTIGHLAFAEFTLKNATILIWILSWIFLIVFPLAFELVSIEVFVIPFSFFSAFKNGALVVLALFVVDFCETWHHIFFEKTFVFGGIIPIV